MKIEARDIARATQAFQQSYVGDCEYGLGDEDAAKGVIAALKALGLIDEASVKHVLRVMEKRCGISSARVIRERAEYYAKRSSPQFLSTMTALAASSKVMERVFRDQIFRQSLTDSPLDRFNADSLGAGGVATFKPEVGPGTFKYQTYELKAEISEEAPREPSSPSHSEPPRPT